MQSIGAEKISLTQRDNDQNQHGRSERCGLGLVLVCCCAIEQFAPSKFVVVSLNKGVPLSVGLKAVFLSIHAAEMGTRLCREYDQRVHAVVFVFP